MSRIEIEGFTKGLPAKAQFPAWWISADGTSPQGGAWRKVGWRVGAVSGTPVDRVIFIRDKVEGKHPAVDQAAIMGTTLAAVITLTISPGEFGPTDLMVGLTLLSIILAYAHLQPWPSSSFRVIFRCAALATAGSLCTILIISWALQVLADHSSLAGSCPKGYSGGDCRGDIVVQHLTVWWFGIT